MKLHLSDMHMVGTKVHHLHEKEERWVSNHVLPIAFIAACLVAGVVIYLLSLIPGVMEGGSWPR